MNVSTRATGRPNADVIGRRTSTLKDVGNPRAYPVSTLVELGETIFGQPSSVVGAALFGHGGSMTVEEAAELLSTYLGFTVTPSVVTIALRAGPFLLGDGAASSFNVAHHLGSTTVAVVVKDKTQSPPAVIETAVEEGADADHCIIAAGAWEEAPPPLNSLEALVFA